MTPNFTLRPLTDEEQKELDRFVLEAYAIDPDRMPACIAADATLENLIPGRMIISKDVDAARARQSLSQEMTEPIIPTKEPKTEPTPTPGEATMIRRSEEEKEKLAAFIAEHRSEHTAQELTDRINKEKICKEPVNISYVRYFLKQCPKTASKRASGAKRGRPKGQSVTPREAATKTELGGGAGPLRACWSN